MSDPTPDGNEITGPSSEPAPPVITTGVVAAPVLRTVIQGGAGAFIVQGIEAFELYAFTDSQRTWSTVALTAAVALVQNMIERLNGRRLIGAPPS